MCMMKSVQYVQSSLVGALKLITALRCCFICSRERSAASAVLESRLSSSDMSLNVILYKMNRRRTALHHTVLLKSHSGESVQTKLKLNKHELKLPEEAHLSITQLTI